MSRGLAGGPPFISRRIRRRVGWARATSVFWVERLAAFMRAGNIEQSKRFVCADALSGVLADAAHLAEDGGDSTVLALLVRDHVRDRVDQGQVGEGLREVAEVAPG